MNNKHIHCGGELTLRKEGSVLEYDTYFCDRCKNIVRVFTAPSYNEYVAEGYIKPRIYFFNFVKQCPKCGTRNTLSAKKCRGCGGKL